MKMSPKGTVNTATVSVLTQQYPIYVAIAVGADYPGFPF
jgi:hypothetical protein